MSLRPEDARVLNERNIAPAVGPKFFRENGEVLFQFVIDSTNVIGPRPATRRDQEQHAGAWAAFTRAEGLSALDRDGDGGEGGSLPAESPPAVPVEEPAPPKPTRKPRRAKRRA
jgi:hypothetical protein